LKAIVKTGLPGAQDQLKYFAKFFKKASSIDTLKMRAYQAKAIRETLGTEGHPTDEIFVDTSGNIIAPIALHPNIREYLGYFPEARRMEEERIGLFRLPPGPRVSSATDHPEVIDSYGVTINDYIFHSIVHMYTLGKRTPASLMAYWRYASELDIPHSGNDFERLCKAVERAKPKAKDSQLNELEEEAKSKRANLLKPWGIEEQSDGTLIVIELSFENTKEIVAQVFGDTVASEKVKKKE
jgi:hypothetical protein